MVVWRLHDYYDIFKISEGKLPFYLSQCEVHFALNRPRGVLECKWNFCKAERSVAGSECRFVVFLLGYFDLSISASASKVDNIVASPRKSIHFSTPGIGYESCIVIAFRFQHTMGKQSVPSFFDTNKINDTHSIWSGSKTYMASILSIFRFSNSLAFGPFQYGAQFGRRSFDFPSSIRCFLALLEPRWPSHILPNYASISTNL